MPPTNYGGDRVTRRRLSTARNVLNQQRCQRIGLLLNSADAKRTGVSDRLFFNATNLHPRESFARSVASAITFKQESHSGCLPKDVKIYYQLNLNRTSTPAEETQTVSGSVHRRGFVLVRSRAAGSDRFADAPTSCSACR